MSHFTYLNKWSFLSMFPVCQFGCGTCMRPMHFPHCFLVLQWGLPNLILSAPSLLHPSSLSLDFSQLSAERKHAMRHRYCVACFSAREAEFWLGSCVPVCYRMAFPTERIANFHLILKVILGPLNGWGHWKMYYLLQCFVNLKFHIIKWCSFRTAQEDGVRRMGNGEENGRNSAGHLILLSLYTLQLVAVYIHLFITCFFFFIWVLKIWEFCQLGMKHSHLSLWRPHLC